MPSAPAIIVAAVFALGGIVLVALAWAAWTRKLPRNHYAGVRTPVTMRSDETFALANKVAAPGIGASGVIMILIAVGVLALPSPLGIATATLVGVVATVLPAGYGAYVGVRAAERLPQPAGCAGSASPASAAPACPYSAQTCGSGQSDGCAGTASCGGDKLCERH